MPFNEIRNQLRSATLTIKNDVVRRFKPETLCTKNTHTNMNYYRILCNPLESYPICPNVCHIKKDDQGYDCEEHII